MPSQEQIELRAIVIQLMRDAGVIKVGGIITPELEKEIKGEG